MTFRIAHLYSDIMNTYGDAGNIITMVYRCRARGIDVQVEQVSIGDQLQPGHFDFYFFGGGQDAGQGLVAADLPRITPTLRQDIQAGAGLLAVCGGYQLLGRYYQAADDTTLEGAGILPISTKAGGRRAMNNIVVAINPTLDIDRSTASTLVGFENHSGMTFIEDDSPALGRVVKGHGNNGQDGTEGIVYHHAVGTYLHGSCLPKNPHLADWLLSRSLQRKHQDFQLAALDDQLEWQAHHQAVGLKP